jgi:hypothetical protein
MLQSGIASARTLFCSPLNCVVGEVTLGAIAADDDGREGSHFADYNVWLYIPMCLENAPLYLPGNRIEVVGIQRRNLLWHTTSTWHRAQHAVRIKIS